MPEIIAPHTSHPERPLPSSQVFISADQVLTEKAPTIVAAATFGIRDVVELMKSPLEVTNVGDKWGEGEYESTEWFTSRARITGHGARYENKLLWGALHRDLQADPRRVSAPHMGFMLVKSDITAVGPDGNLMNFIFGATDTSLGQSVQSIFQFIIAKPELSVAEIHLVTRHIARHEFGHLVGLDELTILNKDERGGIYLGHCNNTCTMQQVASVVEAVDLAQKLEHKDNAGFCNDCVKFLSEK
jgi:predicted Zn-dependent protease